MHWRVYNSDLYFYLHHTLSMKALTTPHWLSQHIDIIKRIYRGEFGSHGIEKWIEIVLCIIKLFMPWFWIKARVQDYLWRNLLIEWYIILKVILLTYVLRTNPESVRSMWIALYFLIDIVQVMLSFVFLNNVYITAPSLRKNFAHLGINLAEIVLSFSIFYLHFQAIWSWWSPITSPIKTLYFSMVTFATVWYGDVWPITTLWELLVIAQIITSFLFITIICSSFVSDLKLKEH